MNEDSRKRSPLRERFREQARAEILAAARRVFTQEGIEESRIDVVAAEAGVSVGTIYNLYGDRAGLVAAVAHRALDVRAMYGAVLDDVEALVLYGSVSDEPGARRFGPGLVDIMMEFEGARP